jgi:hypothetical protein
VTGPAGGNYRAYAGVGSRETPDEILEVMRSVAAKLKADGWTVRSGGAPGADTAFEGGATVFGDYSLTEIFLPWPNFEHRLDKLVKRTHPQREAYAIAERFHPAWARLSQGAKSLHARNVHQILGYDVTKPVLSKFVLCWTEDGSGRGGTGQALRIAREYQVPIFDLGLDYARSRVETWL